MNEETALAIRQQKLVLLYRLARWRAHVTVCMTGCGPDDSGDAVARCRRGRTLSGWVNAAKSAIMALEAPPPPPPAASDGLF